MINMITKPKYSIIIPSRHASDFLEHTLKPIISQSRQDFEVVILINDQKEISYFLEKLLEEDDRFKVVINESELQMSLNYEKALTLAKGDWILLLGADDSILDWFFTVADLIIDRYPGQKLIRWRRAHYFWRNSNTVYGNQVFNFAAKNEIKISRTSSRFVKVLLGFSTMFNMPQIYTCGMIHSTLIDAFRKDGHGQVYRSIIPDIYSSIILLQKSKSFLDIEIPLTLVGTSSSSMNTEGRIYKETEEKAKVDSSLYLHESIPQELHSLAIESLYLLECVRQSPYSLKRPLGLLLECRVAYDLFNLRKKYEISVKEILKVSNLNLSVATLCWPIYFLFIFSDFLGKYFKFLDYYTLSKSSNKKNFIYFESNDAEKFTSIDVAVAFAKAQFSSKIYTWIRRF